MRGRVLGRPLLPREGSLSPSSTPLRDPVGRAAADLHREAARGPAHAGQLQHPEGANPAPRAPLGRWHHRALLQALACKYNHEKMTCHKPKCDMVLTCAGAHQPWQWHCVRGASFCELDKYSV